MVVEEMTQQRHIQRGFGGKIVDVGYVISLMAGLPAADAGALARGRGQDVPLGLRNSRLNLVKLVSPGFQEYLQPQASFQLSKLIQKSTLQVWGLDGVLGAILTNMRPLKM